MKIDKIQCDICGKIVDYNDSDNIICLNEKDQLVRTCYVESIQPPKSNRLLLSGLVKYIKHPTPVINIEYDLCEECLLKIRDLINDLSERSKA